MIGDRLIIQENHLRNAKIIYDKINERNIVLIGGNSGTGKSETADCLQELLIKDKKYSIVLSLDDFYLVHPTIRNYNRKKQGIESVGLSEIDWEALERICIDFKNKKEVHFRRVHKYADVIEHNVIDTDELEILIIEGLYANYLNKFGHGQISAFLEGNPEQTYQFRLNRRKENEEDEFRQKVVQKEFNVICQLKRYANLIIPFGVTDA